MIYADYAATAPISPAVLAEMDDCQRNAWGNPSSQHTVGRKAAEYLSQARDRIARTLGCHADEICFTASGSEADNLALKGTAHAAHRGKHIITTKIEHHAVLRAAEALEAEGFEVTYLDVDENGLLTADHVRQALRPDTVLVSVMAANNEIGTLLPIREIAEAAHAAGAYMMTDAVQAYGNIPVQVDALGVDLLALSGHKIGAPKGIGLLYIRKGTPILPLIHGGGQEHGLRSGTENVPYAVGFARAAEDAAAALEDMKRIARLRDRVAADLLTIPGCRIRGDRIHRLPGNLCVTFDGLSGEAIALQLDLAGICVSTGSACDTHSAQPSHVLLALGLSPEESLGSLRLSLSHGNTDADADKLILEIKRIVSRLRALKDSENERSIRA